MIENKRMEKRKLSLFVFLALLIVLIPFVCNVYYVTSDDPRYIGLVSGAYTGTPMKELIYVGAIIGGVEAFLYSIVPGIEWYSVFYYVLTTSCFCTILWCTLYNKKFGTAVRYVVLALVFILQIYLSLTPQFTTLSTQLGFTSLVCLLYADGRRIWNVWGILLFFLATQMRFAAAFIPYMVAWPLFFMKLGIHNKLWWSRKSWLIGLLMVATLTFCYEKYTYSDEKWNSFQTVNDARAYVADNPIAGEYTKYISVPEDKLAFALWYRYRVFDLNILSTEKIIEYKNIFKEKALETIRYNVKTYAITYLNMGIWLVAILGLILIYELIQKREWWNLVILSIIYIMFVAANLQMMSFSVAKERVMLGSYAALFFATMYMVCNHVRRARELIIASCMILGFQYLIKDYEQYTKNKDNQSLIVETEQMILTSGMPKVMLLVYVHLTPEAFHTSESPIYTHSIIQGWLHFYPKADLRYQPFTSFTDGLPILVDKKNIEQIRIIRQLLQMHYGIRSYSKTIKESEHYVLIELIPVEDINDVVLKNTKLSHTS